MTQLQCALGKAWGSRAATRLFLYARHVKTLGPPERLRPTSFLFLLLILLFNLNCDWFTDSETGHYLGDLACVTFFFLSLSLSSAFLRPAFRRCCHRLPVVLVFLTCTCACLRLRLQRFACSCFCVSYATSCFCAAVCSSFCWCCCRSLLLLLAARYKQSNLQVRVVFCGACLLLLPSFSPLSSARRPPFKHLIVLASTFLRLPSSPPSILSPEAQIGTHRLSSRGSVAIPPPSISSPHPFSLLTRLEGSLLGLQSSRFRLPFPPSIHLRFHRNASLRLPASFCALFGHFVF